MVHNLGGSGHKVGSFADWSTLETITVCLEGQTVMGRKMEGRQDRGPDLSPYAQSIQCQIAKSFLCIPSPLCPQLDYYTSF